MSLVIDTEAGGSPTTEELIATDLEMVDENQPEATVALDLSLHGAEESDEKADFDAEMTLKNAPIEAPKEVIENATDEALAEISTKTADAEGTLKASSEKTVDEPTAEGTLKSALDIVPDQEVAAAKDEKVEAAPAVVPQADLMIDAEVVAKTSPEKALESEAVALVEGSVVTSPEILEGNGLTVVNEEIVEDEIPKLVEKTEDLPKDVAVESEKEEPANATPMETAPSVGALLPKDETKTEDIGNTEAAKNPEAQTPKGETKTEAIKPVGAKTAVDGNTADVKSDVSNEYVTLLTTKLPMLVAADKGTGDKGLKSTEPAKGGKGNDSTEKADGKNVESKNQEQHDSMEIDNELTERAGKRNPEENKENDNADGNNVKPKIRMPEKSSGGDSKGSGEKRSRASGREKKKDRDGHSSSGDRRSSSDDRRSSSDDKHSTSDGKLRRSTRVKRSKK